MPRMPLQHRRLAIVKELSNAKLAVSNMRAVVTDQNESRLVDVVNEALNRAFERARVASDPRSVGEELDTVTRAVAALSQALKRKLH